MAKHEQTERPKEYKPAPRWVKISAGIGVAVLLLMTAMMVSGHGPWQHLHTDSIDAITGIKP